MFNKYLLKCFTSFCYSTSTVETVHFPGDRLRETKESEGSKVGTSNQEVRKPPEIQDEEVPVPGCSHHATELYGGIGEGKFED
jgi:hypothetical protein